MSKVLKAAGSGLEHIVKANVYLTDMANFGPMNEVYAQVSGGRCGCPLVLYMSELILLMV
jgi:enamine deaminase RidA (YjgF/YER057c/UK114 family)